MKVCKGCLDRHMACHDSCSRYKEAKKNHDLAKAWLESFKVAPTNRELIQTKRKRKFIKGKGNSVTIY